eukprot:Amastigsp_a844279_19.p3 type:complete len:158 gc:universal Amastigsp_a844279_19:46-519(+)
MMDTPEVTLNGSTTERPPMSNSHSTKCPAHPVCGVSSVDTNVRFPESATGSSTQKMGLMQLGSSRSPQTMSRKSRALALRARRRPQRLGWTPLTILRVTTVPSAEIAYSVAGIGRPVTIAEYHASTVAVTSSTCPVSECSAFATCLSSLGPARCGHM